MRQPVTIKDVALRAGCGVATVSRVLNNTGSASANMRGRVLAATDALGFEFSEVGRSLQSNTTRTIGCVVPSLANPVFADAVQGAQEVFQSAGYQTLLVCTNYDSEFETQAIRMLMAKQVDGFVLTVSDAHSSEGLASIQGREIPHCLLFNMAPDKEQSWSVDDCEIEEDSLEIKELLLEFLQKNPTLTGIFASNDFLALATIRSARALGLRVPQDLSIVGFDGIEVGTMVEPSLATIATDPKMMGSGAARTVLSVINNTPTPDLPDPKTTFSFRAGGSLASAAAEREDGKKAVTFSPSSNPTKKNDKIQRERLL